MSHPKPPARVILAVAAALGLSYGAATWLVEDVIEDEGIVMDRASGMAKPYRDSIGKPTVCFGSTRNVDMGRLYPMDECWDRLVEDIIDHGLPVVRRMRQAARPIADGPIVAWIGGAFNFGVHGALASSGVRAAAAAASDEAICAPILRYTFVTVDGRKVDCRTAGRLCPGIVVRRDRQYRRCMSGNAETTPARVVLMEFTVQ